MAEYIKISDHSGKLSLSKSCLKQPGQYLEIATLPRPLVALVIMYGIFLFIYCIGFELNCPGSYLLWFDAS